MLYLNPPYYVINDVSLLPDHADPLQWYYMPMAPRLTRITDPVSHKRIPSIQVVKYRGQAGNGGFLNFDVNLGLDQGELEDVADELKRQARLRDRPKLAPVPLVDGTVKMMLLGTQTGDAPPATATLDSDTPSADAVGPPFVIKIDQHAKPSLYGNNQAAFSVKLDQDSVTVLEKALQGEMSPIGIVYSLEYLALRRAYSIRVHADWNRVQTHLSEKFSVNTPIYSSSIDKTVDKLIDERAIDVQVDTFVPEGEDSGTIIAERDQWVNEVRDMVTDAFFEPSLDPVREKDDTASGAASTFGRVMRMIATGGMGGDPLFQRKKVDYTRIDQKKLNVTMNSRTTVKRSIHPQGHLSGLVRILKNEGLDIGGFILEVDLDDPWFQRRRVSVISRADFTTDAIESVNARLRYGQEPKNVILDPAKPTGEVNWGSLFTGDVMRRDVSYTYQVNFKGVDGSERPVKLTSAEAVVDVENLEINPRELYAIAPVPIVALSFPWNLYPHVEVQTQYRDEANGIRMADAFLLDEKNPEKTWSMFVRDPRFNRFQYKVTYRAADQKDVAMPWVETDAEQIILRDPFPSKRTLVVVPVFAWTEVQRAFVDVTYEDTPNGVLESKAFEFTETHQETQSFSVGLVNTKQNLISFKVTVIFKDGRIVEIPRSLTRENRITVTSNMRGRRIVLVRLASLDFAKKKLKQVRVETRHEDSGAGLSTAATFDFSSKDGSGYFEFDYVDEQKSDYEHKVTYRYLNGLSKSVNWSKADAEELVVPLA
ncbi:MAG: hypothetical protein M3547_01515 [Acidobacteriota bacterium]|nr:hypothetical protein [Acidobacteriota bacterium]